MLLKGQNENVTRAIARDTLKVNLKMIELSSMITWKKRLCYEHSVNRDILEKYRTIFQYKMEKLRFFYISNKNGKFQPNLCIHFNQFMLLVKSKNSFRKWMKSHLDTSTHKSKQAASSKPNDFSFLSMQQNWLKFKLSDDLFWFN